MSLESSLPGSGFQVARSQRPPRRVTAPRKRQPLPRGAGPLGMALQSSTLRWALARNQDEQRRVYFLYFCNSCFFMGGGGLVFVVFTSPVVFIYIYLFGF